MRQIKLGVPNAELVQAGDMIEEMRWIKDDDELNIMRRGIYFSDFSIQAGREFVQSHGAVIGKRDPESRGRCARRQDGSAS